MVSNVNYTIKQESLTGLVENWESLRDRLPWQPLFVLPPWLQTWWDVGRDAGEDALVWSVYAGEQLIGIAPLQVKEKTVSFLSSDDVCDYLDFVVASGWERDFFTSLLTELERRNLRDLDLGLVRPESTVFNHLVPLAGERGYSVEREAVDLSLEMELPGSWEDYLAGLSKKQRHEVRRKLRRLAEAGESNYYTLGGDDITPEVLDKFLELFTQSRSDKESYLTEQRECFFRRLVETMAAWNMARCGVLELDSRPVAMLLYFDYAGEIYLYNSGFDSRYCSLSVGLVSKILCIKESISGGRQIFNFLKGNEAYKYRLGGREVPLSRCRLTLGQD